jgi:class 3 adenylate cyclase/tetratricopeptide (TPR) repeat protein
VTEVASTCLSCGNIGRPGDRFCSGCGKPLSAAPASGGAPPSKNLASSTSAPRRASAGERKRATVMFADLIGSTATIEHLDPEAALSQLEPPMQIMTRLVQRYEGVVCRRMGDGILALFGAPVAHEDHAVRACFAALGIQQELRDAGMVESVRIGLSSGDVLYRTISSELGLEIDVVGLAVHIASRMEQMATPGSVYLTSETQALTQGLIETRNIGLRQVKGASAPIDTYEAIGASPYRSRWQALAARERAPFVGRDEERIELATALAALAEWRGSVVGISGEAGLGKSRLLRSIVREDRSRARYRVTMASATAFGGDVPYHALVSALRDLFGISESDDAARSLDAVAAGLEQIDPALASDAPVLSSLIVLSSATQDWLAMNPRSKRDAVRDACVRLVRAMAGRIPAVFIFEDLHWIDRDSQYVLEAISDLARREPLLVMLTYRTEYDDSWLSTLNGRRLRLSPLSDDEIRHSLREWFVEGPEAEHVIERLVARVGGNPLFVEECVRALAQQGTLTAVSMDAAGSGALRRYACWLVPKSIEMPPSVHDVIASRIDRRSPSCVALLNTLSVVNRRIPLWLVERVSGQSPAATTATLHEAVSAEILMSVTLSPDVEYDFTHAVLREVAHDSMTRFRRAEAHRGVFASIESYYSDRLQDHAEWLAHHAAEGELWDQAAVYQGHAAERALVRGSYAEAIAGIRSALRSYEQSSRSVAATQRAIDHHLRLRRMLSARGVSSEETQPLILRAEQLADGIGDRVRLGWAWNERAGALWIAGENREAIATARRAIEIAQHAGEVRLQASALQRLGVSLHAIGDCVGAAQALRQCCDLLTGDLRFEIIASTFPTFVLAGGYLVATLCDLGRYEEAERQMAEVIAVATASRNLSAIGSAQTAHCILAAARGDVATTIAPLEALLAAVKAEGVLQVVQPLKLQLGRAKLLIGEPAAAADLLDGTGDIESIRHSYIHRLTRACYAEALAAQGALSQAEAVLDQVEGAVAEHGEAGTFARCWIVRAKIAFAAGDLARAKIAYEHALQQAAALSLRPVCEICEAELAAIASRQSRSKSILERGYTP